MLKLNKEFLEDLGLETLPDEKQQELMRHIYNELESRVGERLAEGMSNEKLDEFGMFVDHDTKASVIWLMEHCPTSFSDVVSDFGAQAWLQHNRPDYPEVVSNTLEGIKQEIKDSLNVVAS